MVRDETIKKIVNLLKEDGYFITEFTFNETLQNSIDLNGILTIRTFRQYKE